MLRPRLVPKEAYLNFGLVLISALGGYTLFGFFGVVYGPVLLILLLTALEVYEQYYASDPPVATDASVAPPAAPRAAAVVPDGVPRIVGASPSADPRGQAAAANESDAQLLEELFDDRPSGTPAIDPPAA